MLEYLDPDYTPPAKNMREVIMAACEELTIPIPGIKLNDWPIWSKMTGGFRLREFSILCGATGSGKTTFLSNLSAQLLKQRVKHFVMSVETGHTDFMKRIMSVFAGEDINSGEIIPARKVTDLIKTTQEHLASDSIEFSLYEDRVPVERLKADIVYMVQKKSCKIVMIDNLNFFMEVTRAADAVVEMDRVIHELIILCKQIDVHIVMVMHPKKNSVTGSTRILSEWDIKGSSTAVQEAHNIFFFNRPDPDLIKTGQRSTFERELTIGKMRRRGQHTGQTIILQNQGTRYVERGFA